MRRMIAELLQAGRRLEHEVAAQYAVEVLSQLDRLHSFVANVDGRRRAVVHGDIKPSNIQIGAKIGASPRFRNRESDYVHA